MNAQRLRRPVAGDENAQLAPRRLDGHENLARRRRKSLRENLEVVDERFHLRLHLLALRWNDAGRFGPHRTLRRNLLDRLADDLQALAHLRNSDHVAREAVRIGARGNIEDRKSTRLNSSHDQISYAVFCLKKK